MSTVVEDFVRERDAALRSLDEARIRAMAIKHGTNMPADELTFWGAVHKARLSLSYFSPEEHEVSARWLREHGFTRMGI